ncbi:MAG: DNA binding protein [Pycnora praestabilis]|nr:MAG: DNA binding protein [Pycnora praestabilis]
MQAVVRGKSPTTDQLLDWLEYGVFEALERKVLATLQLVISAQKSPPFDALETYTFAFQYKSDYGSDISLLAGLKVLGTDGKLVTVQNVKEGLLQIIRRLILLETHLPALSGKNEDKNVLVTRSTNLQASVGVLVNYSQQMNHGRWKQPMSESSMQDFTCKLINLDLMSYTEGISVTLEVATMGQQKANSPSPENTSPNQIGADDANKMSEKGIVSIRRRGPANRNRHVVPPLYLQSECTPSDAADTQEMLQKEADDVVMKALLKHMTVGQNSSQSSNLIETQCLELIPPLTDGSTNVLERQKSLAAGGSSGIHLSQSVREDLQSRKHTLSKPRSVSGQSSARARGAKVGKVKACDIVDCPCGINVDEGDMLQCDSCNTWQHCHCHGFNDYKDYRIPNSHMCYKCLLDRQDDRRLSTLSWMCKKRKALKIIHGKSRCRTHLVLISTLPFSSEISNKIIECLTKEGYLESRQSKVHRGKQQPGLSVVKTCQQLEIMKTQYFDPTREIAHLLKSPEENFEEVTHELGSFPLAAHGIVPKYNTFKGLSKRSNSMSQEATRGSGSLFTQYDRVVEDSFHTTAFQASIGKRLLRHDEDLTDIATKRTCVEV